MTESKGDIGFAPPDRCKVRPQLLMIEQSARLKKGLGLRFCMRRSWDKCPLRCAGATICDATVEEKLVLVPQSIPMVWFDRIITAGILFLVVFTPLAIGAVYPWSVSVVEITIFILTIVWMARLALMTGPQKLARAAFLWVPAVCFIAFMLVQLLPMPPAWQRLVSPSTYSLYAASLPGWPHQAPYDDPGSGAVRSQGRVSTRRGSMGRKLREQRRRAPCTPLDGNGAPSRSHPA